jgi:hypothetical protein
MCSNKPELALLGLLQTIGEALPSKKLKQSGIYKTETCCIFKSKSG